MTAIHITVQSKFYHNESQFNPALVIQNLHLSLKSGEFVCLVGPSGCGKTTLLNIVAGLDRNFEGSVRIGEQTAEPRIGYVFQNPRLLPWRTVRENIDLVLPGDTNPAYVDHLFEMVGLTNAGNIYPERLSLGMSRRVALVRAFAINPDLLLMDEPFVSLDPPTARRVRELVVKLWQERPHTVLFVTHDLREAIELADRLVFLTPSPASIVCDIPIDLSRQDRDESAVEKLRKGLYADFPTVRTLL
jgi:NitT/TauT family transport system ATP-binding protein